MLSSRVEGRGHLTDKGVEFDNQRETTHYLDPTSISSTEGKLALTGQDAERLKEAAAEKSSSANAWIVESEKNIAKDIKEVVDIAKTSSLSSGSSAAFGQALASKVENYDTQNVQKFEMIKEVLGNADPTSWTSNENQSKILSHIGHALSAFLTANFETLEMVVLLSFPQGKHLSIWIIDMY